MPLSFSKMHGAGNDFVILDARKQPIGLTSVQIGLIADRNKGVGCDQLIVMEPPRAAGAAVFMAIYNSDGSHSGACGNATRCVARLLMEETGRESLVIETVSGLLPVTRTGAVYTVDMGPARTDWGAIPLSTAQDTLSLDVHVPGLPPAVAVNMGNPHAVFFVPDIARCDVARLGPLVERHGFFPERTNVEFVQVESRTRLRMRVWERGSGITLACGSGACAALVAAARRGLSERKAKLVLDGGTLLIEWLENNHVLMSGPAALSFTGVLADELLTS